MKLNILPSLSKGNVYYIWRDNGIEVEVKIKAQMFQPSIRLTPAERRYFKLIVPPKQSNIKYKPNGYKNVLHHTKMKVVYYFLNLDDNSNTNISRFTGVKKFTVLNILEEYLTGQFKKTL